MTLLVSWVGIDTHGVSSAYIATDSRLSWGDKHTFDCAIKTFFLRNYPAVIGYCGDSLSALMIISQSVNIIDSMAVNQNKTTFDSVVDIFRNVVSRGYNNYPDGSDVYSGSIEIVLAGRKAIDSKEFSVVALALNKLGNDARIEYITIPEKSGIVYSAGSGRALFDKNNSRYNKLDTNAGNANTSRNAFHAFVDSLNNDGTPSVGGAPQVVSVIRNPKAMGMTLGLVYNGRSYISGHEIDDDLMMKGGLVQRWFNENFEITNPFTKRRNDGAQIQPDSLRR